jgi:hypothetical protein
MPGALGLLPAAALLLLAAPSLSAQSVRAVATDAATGAPVAEGRELHHVIGPRDIKAVEVYREWSEVPPEFQRYASNGMYRCGAYLYWTQARW